MLGAASYNIFNVLHKNYQIKQKYIRMHVEYISILDKLVICNKVIADDMLIERGDRDCDNDDDQISESPSSSNEAQVLLKPFRLNVPAIKMPSNRHRKTISKE